MLSKPVIALLTRTYGRKEQYLYIRFTIATWNMDEVINYRHHHHV